MFVISIVQKMRKIVLEEYFIDIKQEKFMRKMNIDNYVILLKGWRWTTMDDVAERAYRGMTVQMEHTTCEDPLTDESAFNWYVSCIFFYIICAACLMFQYFSDEKFSSLETPCKDPHWRMTPQTEHTKQGSTDGRRSQQTTPTEPAHSVFSSFPWVSNN